MPNRKTHKRNTSAHARRRYLTALLLLPIAGCSLPNGIPRFTSLKPRMPWSAGTDIEIVPALDTDRETKAINVSAPTKSIFRLAGFRDENDDGTDEDENSDTDALSFDNDESKPELPPAIDVNELVEPIVSETQTDSIPSGTPQSIDLGTAIGMAGGSAWTIHLARQRTVEAHANLDQARALWLPNLQLGVGYNKHDGRIQATDGTVIETSRNSLFFGGGATLGAPIAGGSGGPLRLQADLELADAYFEPKIARRALSAQSAGVSVARNQAVLDAGVAYVDLVEAAGQLADSRTALASAGELVQLTRSFADAGAGSQADVDRAATEEARLTGLLHDANRQFRVRSASLSRTLRLDPRFVLQPADQIVVPIELAAFDSDLDSQIALAVSRRPEVLEHSHRIAGLCLAVEKADVEPWLPSVTVATSAGNFGGGQGSNLDSQASRSDVDLQAVWELDSMGLGVSARRSRAGSQLSQQRIQLANLRDQISSQVVQAYENVLNYRAQIEAADAALTLAESSYERNLQRVRADEGLPIELLQAITARAAALSIRTAAVSNYNRSQLYLLYATGQLHR